jgi:hypothetical protein
MRTNCTCTLVHLFRCSFPPPPTPPVVVPPAAFNPAKVLHDSNERQLQETPIQWAFLIRHSPVVWNPAAYRGAVGSGAVEEAGARAPYFATSTRKPAMLCDFYLGFFSHSKKLPAYHFKIWTLSSVHCTDINTLRTGIFFSILITNH